MTWSSWIHNYCRYLMYQVVLEHYLKWKDLAVLAQALINPDGIQKCSLNGIASEDHSKTAGSTKYSSPIIH